MLTAWPAGRERLTMRIHPHRRLHPAAAVLWLVALALAGCFTDEDERSSAQKASPPNILMVLTDDQTESQYSLRSMPFTWRYMRAHATTFTNYMVTSPLCCPARAGIITGQYGHNNGVLVNSYSALRKPAEVLPVWLQRAGYQTAHVGKFLNNYGKTLSDPAEVTPGWDDWFTQLEPQRYFDYDISDDGEVVHYGTSDDDYLTRVLTEHATDLIESWAEGDQPFYLALDYFAPHFGGEDPARRCNGAPVPDPRDQDRFTRATVPGNPSVNETALDDKPHFIQALPPLTAFRQREANQRYRCALASLRAVDRGFRAVVQALEESGLLENTVLVFSSDNGYFYGEHRIPDDKQVPYRETYEVPLQIGLPTRLVERSVASTNAEVANIDLTPTFLELARADPCVTEGECRTVDGHSLLPLLGARGADSNAWPDSRPRGLELNNSSAGSSRGGTCHYYGVRTGRWVYVRHVTTALPHGECLPSVEAELYDLKDDPQQLENLAQNDPELRARLDRLARGIRRCAGSAPASGETGPTSQGLCP
jgi:N-acetylglucosamine-6-sulfatase